MGATSHRRSQGGIITCISITRQGLINDCLIVEARAEKTLTTQESRKHFRSQSSYLGFTTREQKKESGEGQQAVRASPVTRASRVMVNLCKK